MVLGYEIQPGMVLRDRHFGINGAEAQVLVLNVERRNPCFRLLAVAEDGSTDSFLVYSTMQFDCLAPAIEGVSP